MESEPEAPRPTFRASPLDFALRLFADVRAGEAITALVLTLNVFLLLTAYYLLKVAREPLILMGGGAEVKSYAAVGQSILLVFVTAAYGWIAQRVDRLRLIALVTLFFAGNLIVFWFLGRRGVPLGVPFFLWVGVFNLTIVAQFWSFAADVYTAHQGKRLFPILGIGSSVGAVAGAGIARLLYRLGPFTLMLIASALLVVCLALTTFVHRRETWASRKGEPRPEEPLVKGSGFALMLRDKYLLLVGALMFILNAVNKTGEYILDRALLAGAPAEATRLGINELEYVGKFKSEYFEYVNVAGVVLQLFAVSRIIRYVGVRRALLVMPLVSLAGYSTLAIWPVLGVALFVKVAENSLDYSLANTANQSLWLVTSRSAKYKAKQVIDTFLVRAGDVLSAGLVWTGTRLGFTMQHYVVANVALVVAWGGTVLLLGRKYAAKSATESPVAGNEATA